MIGVLFVLLFWSLKYFLPALLGAYTFYVLLRTPLRFLNERWKIPRPVATALLMLISFFMIMIPINGLVQIVQARVMASIQGSNDIYQSIEKIIQDAEARVGLKMLTPEYIKRISDWGLREMEVILNMTANGLALFLLLYLILWFMLTDSKRMEDSFFNWLPLKPPNVTYVRQELNDLVYANALGIPLMGLVQGAAGFLGYWLSGVPDMWLWTLATFITGMVPVFGVALTYIPLAILLFAQGMTGKAVFVLIYGITVIGSVDNLARMWLLKKIGHTHPLITFFGVLAGLELFGFIGLIFGPIMIAMFLLLLKVYDREFREAG
jgi:predicted PurR-regulated permease PerM